MGVTVVTNQHGFLRFRIYWKGQDIAVSTRYRDDGPHGRNRRLVNAKALLIEENLRHGAELHRALLEVLGDCPPRLMPTPSSAPKLRTLRSYYEEWIERKVPPLVRLSTAKRHRLCFEAIVLPELGSALFQEITKSRLEAFRGVLLRGNTQRGTTRTVKAVRILSTGIFVLCGATRKEKGMRARSPAWIGPERIAPNLILLTLRSATRSWGGSRRMSRTGVHGYSFCFGLACATAKALRCDGMTST